ncbi:MAG: condensation domain-containing protein, partial [Anaerolineales bacterium]
IDANAHQELPFGKLVEELQPRRDASRNPIFQVEFTLLNPEHAPPVYGYGFRSPVQQKIEIQGVTLTPMEIESGVSKFDLTVLLWDMPGGVSGTFEYNMDLFEHYTIIQLAENYQTLLRHTVATPNIRISVLKDVFAQRRHTIGANRQTPARGTPTVAKRRKQIRPRKLKKIPRRRRKGDF